ncbi:MAG: hypothetical protein ACKVP5_16150 [Aestuariivirga sp.]
MTGRFLFGRGLDFPFEQLVERFAGFFIDRRLVRGDVQGRNRISFEFVCFLRGRIGCGLSRVGGILRRIGIALSGVDSLLGRIDGAGEIGIGWVRGGRVLRVL